MPTYEYICRSCENKLEAFQKITADPLKICPKCSQETLYRQIGGGMATLRFKGSGFYVNDYRSKENDKSSSCCKDCPNSSGGNSCSENA